jgi:hypothetical protein
MAQSLRPDLRNSYKYQSQLLGYCLQVQVQKGNGEWSVDANGRSSFFAYSPIVAATDGQSGSAAGGGLLQLSADRAAFNVTHPERNQVKPIKVKHNTNNYQRA